MTDTNLLSLMFKELCRIAGLIGPWIEPDEMRMRYNVTAQTLRAMERRGDIPSRHSGRWSRVEVMQWEQRKTV